MPKTALLNLGCLLGPVNYQYLVDQNKVNGLKFSSKARLSSHLVPKGTTIKSGFKNLSLINPKELHVKRVVSKFEFNFKHIHGSDIVEPMKSGRRSKSQQLNSRININFYPYKLSKVFYTGIRNKDA